MTNWRIYEKVLLDIQWITRYCGGDEELAVYFQDKLGDSYQLYFDQVLDFRYGLENAYLATIADSPDGIPGIETVNIAPDITLRVFVLTDSEYLKHYERATDGATPIEDIMHFMVFDYLDTGLEILSTSEPVLVKLDYDLKDYSFPNFSWQEATEQDGLPLPGVITQSSEMMYNGARHEKGKMAGWTSYEGLGVRIKQIVRYMGGDRKAAVYFFDGAGDGYRLHFDSAFDFRCAAKAVFDDTLAQIPTELLGTASMFVGTESGYLKRFEHEVCGTIPLDDIRHYALFDDAGYGVETLSFSEPILTKLGYDLNDYVYPKFKLGTAGQRGRGNCPTYLGE